MTQQELRFDGPEYKPKRDRERLTGQCKRVFDAMRDSRWYTTNQLAEITGDPHNSITAQFRHLRKERFGSHTVNRRHIERGLFEYQLIPNGPNPADNKKPPTGEASGRSLGLEAARKVLK